jgi:hypothetical protein
MSAYQDTMARLQAQQAAQQEGSRALQRVQEIGQQLASMPRTVPAQQSPTAAAARGAMEAPVARAAAPVADEATGEQAQINAGMGRLQEGQAQAAAAGEGSAPQGGIVGAQEAAGGANTATTASPENTPPPAAQAAPAASPLVPDDQQGRREIIQLMQNASGQNRTLSPDEAQAARQQLLERFQIDPLAADAAHDLGMLDDLHPDHLATDLQMIKINQLLKSDPTNPMAAAEGQALTRVGQKALDLFDQMGAAPDVSAMSQKANQLLAEQNTSLKGDVSNILDKQIPAMVPKTSEVPATSALDMINQELTNLGGSSPLLNRDWRRAQALLLPKDEPVTVSGQQIAGSQLGIAPKNPTYHAIDTLRKQLNAADRGTGPFVNMEQASRRKLAQALSQDQGAYLRQVNPQAYGLWRQANAKVQLYKAVQDDMQSLFGKSAEQSMLPVVKNAVQGLATGNVENFTRVVSAIPKQMRNEVLMSTLQGMFTRAGKNEFGPFGFQQAATFFRSFKKDSAAWSALMANLEPDARTMVSNLAKVADRIAGSISAKEYTGRSRFAKELSTDLNDVPTTLVERLRDTAAPIVGRTVGGAIGGAMSHIPVVGGALGAAAHGAGAFAARIVAPNKTPVDKAISDFLLSDDAKDALAHGAAMTEPQVRAVANSPSFRRVTSLLQLPNNPATREHWLRGALTSSATLSSSSTTPPN